MAELERNTIPAGDVIAAYKTLAAGGTPAHWKKNDGWLGRGIFNGTQQRWTGATTKQMLGWLNDGYRAKALDIGSADDVIAATRRRLRPQDDGELQVDLALSGFDMPYLEWTRRPAKPGLRITALFNLSAGVDHKDVAAFGQWVRSLVEAVTVRGYDVSIEVAVQCNSIYGGSDSGYGGDLPQEVAVRIKNENEAFDNATWSAFLSPGGFRHLVFTAMVEAAERRGMTAHRSLGRPIRPDEEMTFDPVSRRLIVASYGGRFDVQAATENVAFALGLDTGETDWQEGRFDRDRYDA